MGEKWRAERSEAGQGLRHRLRRHCVTGFLQELALEVVALDFRWIGLGVGDWIEVDWSVIASLCAMCGRE